VGTGRAGRERRARGPMALRLARELGTAACGAGARRVLRQARRVGAARLPLRGSRGQLRPHPAGPAGAAAPTSAPCPPVLDLRGPTAGLTEATVEGGGGGETVHAPPWEWPGARPGHRPAQGARAHYPELKELRVIDARARNLPGLAGSAATARVLVESTDGRSFLRYRRRVGGPARPFGRRSATPWSTSSPKDDVARGGRRPPPVTPAGRGRRGRPGPVLARAPRTCPPGSPSWRSWPLTLVPSAVEAASPAPAPARACQPEGRANLAPLGGLPRGPRPRRDLSGRESVLLGLPLDLKPGLGGGPGGGARAVRRPRGRIVDDRSSGGRSSAWRRSSGAGIGPARLGARAPSWR